MNSIYKYELEIKSYQQLRLPSGAEVLKVAEAYERIFAWVLVNVDYLSVTEMIDFYIYPTGGTMTDNALNEMTYIDTLVMPNCLVWHIYKGEQG